MLENKFTTTTGIRKNFADFEYVTLIKMTDEILR